MFRLVHLSDVHLGPLPKVSRRELASKRITGYVNWHRNRRVAMGSDTLDKLIAHVHTANADHIVITGDLVNLALDAEIELIADWMRSVGAPKSVTVIPGNHDTYVPGALDKIRHAWQPYMSGDDMETSVFPFRRDVSTSPMKPPVSLIAANSGRATLPFLATGSFRKQQAKDLAALLAQAKVENRFRVVLIHHPPFPNATHWHKRLIGADRFCGVIQKQGAELVLHGHTHIESDQTIDGPYQPVRVVGVPSASQQAPAKDAEKGRPGAQYNLFEIKDGDLKNGTAWSVHWQQYGYAKGSNVVANLASQSFDIAASGVQEGQLKT